MRKKAMEAFSELSSGVFSQAGHSFVSGMETLPSRLADLEALLAGIKDPMDIATQLGSLESREVVENLKRQVHTYQKMSMELCTSTLVSLLPLESSQFASSDGATVDAIHITSVSSSAESQVCLLQYLRFQKCLPPCFVDFPSQTKEYSVHGTSQDVSSALVDKLTMVYDEFSVECIQLCASIAGGNENKASEGPVGEFENPKGVLFP